MTDSKEVADSKVEFQIAIGEAITRVRTVRKLSQSRLALLSKLSTPKLISIEQGQSEFVLKEMQKIAQALNMPSEELLKLAKDLQTQKSTPSD